MSSAYKLYYFIIKSVCTMVSEKLNQADKPYVGVLIGGGLK